MKVRVLPGCEIMFNHRWYYAGKELEMSEKEAKALKGKVAVAGQPPKSEGKAKKNTGKLKRVKKTAKKS